MGPQGQGTDYFPASPFQLENSILEVGVGVGGKNKSKKDQSKGLKILTLFLS